MTQYRENLTTKKITEFEASDTIYITDVHGFNKPYVLCQFVSYDKGFVTGTVLEIDKQNPHQHSEKVGGTLKAKLDRCALYGSTTKSRHTSFYSFKPTGYALHPDSVEREDTTGRERHPSYGVATLSRVSSSHHHAFFGSSLKHSQYVEMRLHEAELYRDGGRQYAFSKNTILSVAFTSVQWGEFVSSFDSGSGVPCTILSREGSRVAEPPWESKIEQYHNEFKARLRNAMRDMKSLISDLDLVLDKPNCTKTDRQYIREQLDRIEKQLTSNVPYVAGEFIEQMEKTVTEAKASIEAFYESKIRSLGLEAFADEVKQLTAPEID